MIRRAKLSDAGALSDLYNYYILNTVVTFEEQPITALDMLSRIAEVTDAELPWLVAEQNHAIVGFGCASKLSASAMLVSGRGAVLTVTQSR
ncbi:MAG: GNAT family N-acetyltransferase [Arenicella sp.]|nr:GNAT family N-acetyltransferase [Arenicella sp.]